MKMQSNAALQALRRADQVESVEGTVTRDWYAPIVADAEAGFGGVLNAFELMKVRVCGLKPLLEFLLLATGLTSRLATIGSRTG